MKKVPPVSVEPGHKIKSCRLGTSEGPEFLTTNCPTTIEPSWDASTILLGCEFPISTESGLNDLFSNGDLI